MAATVQSQAIQNANTIMSLAAQLLALSSAITQVGNAWTDDSSANTLNAMATVALNTDGSQGTADGSPNNAHPLSLTLFPTLTRSISSNQIASMLTVLQTIPTLVGGSAVGAQAGMRAILNSATGG